MEAIKNTVSHVLGTSKSHETDATTDSTLGHHTASSTTTENTLGHQAVSSNTADNTLGHHAASGTTTDNTLGHHAASGTTTDTTGYSSGTTTGVPGATNDAAPSYHDRTTAETGNTLSQGATGTSTTGTGDLGVGRDTVATSGTAGLSHGTSGTTGTTGVGHGTSDTTSTTHDTRPDNLSPTRSHPDRSEVQSPDQGPDPALVGDAREHPKMVGQGTPGSHSAVFGLTPDGKRYDDSSHGTTPIRPAHSDQTTLGRKSVVGASGADSGGDTVSGGRGGVSDQIDAPDVGKKGLERTDPAPISSSNSGGKPGAGLTGLGQS
jgi:hypothetical protein